MKPEVLTLRAFEAYPKEEVIDFRQLGERSLFLIHGETGSGKSSILDGLTYALYGESSGAERNGRQLRSDHADLGTPTSVEFIFRNRGKRYRVARAPEQERPKRRTIGTTTEAASATLWEDTGSLGAENWEVRADGFSNVTEAVREILKLDANQFRQVVVLPQGRFEEFLKAGSQARQEILETLFQTALYGRLENALGERAKALRIEVDALRDKAAALREAAAVTTDAELQAAVESLDREIASLAGLLDNARVIEAAAFRVLGEGQATAVKFTELTDASSALAKLQVRADEMRVVKERLSRHHQARALDDVVGQAVARRGEHQAALHTREEAVRQCGEAEAAVKTSTDRLAVEQAKAPERARLTAERVTLEALRPKVARFAKTLEQVEQAAKAAQDAETSLKAAKLAQETFRKDIEQHQAVREADLALAAKKGEVTAEATRLANLLVQVERLNKLRDSAKRGIAVLQKDDKALEAAEKASKAAEKGLEVIETRWRKGYSVVLAKGLSDGYPCLVCGAKHHPAPARGRGEYPTDEEIEQAKTSVKDSRECLDKARAQVAEDRSKADALAQSIRDIEGYLGEDENMSVAAINDAIVLSGAVVKESEAAVKRVAGHDAAIKKLKQDEKEGGARMDGVEGAVKKANAQSTTAQAELKGLEQDIPEAYRAANALETAIMTIATALTVLEGALKQAQQDSEQAARAGGSGAAALSAAEKTLKIIESTLAQVEEQARKRMEAGGFPDEAVWRAARLDDDEGTRLESLLKEHQDAMVVTQGRLTRAEAACQGLVCPDISVLEASHVAARQQVEESTSKHVELSERLRTIKAIAEQVADLSGKAKSSEDAYSLVGSLYETAHGKNEHRMSLQRYVLATMLDSVLSVASQKFRRMSDGRYILKRMSGTRDQRGAGGLDLVVADEYTGKTRDVVTLSGGEKFLASLALALALAEVVQEYAGGVQLDSVFIDEGFGSLDEEKTLDQAMQVFSEMRAGGRLVGVISHVSGLRERIDARLEVLAGRNGSTTRFLV